MYHLIEFGLARTFILVIFQTNLRRVLFSKPPTNPQIWDTRDTSNIKLLGSRSFPTDLECVAVSPDRVSHVCGGVNSTSYLSLFVGVDEEAHQHALDRFSVR